MRSVLPGAARFAFLAGAASRGWSWAGGWLVGVWLLLTLNLTLQLAAADCAPAPGGLVSWWPGDGYAADIAGTNSGVLQGGATASAAGLVGSAFGFDGTNGFVQIPDLPSLRPTNLTIECWVQFSSLDSAGSGGSPAGDQYIVFKQNSRKTTFEGFDLSKTRVGSNNMFRFTVSSGSGQSAVIRSSTLISTGAWYHVAAVRGTNFIQLHVNGALERQTNVSFPQDYASFPLYFGTSGQSYWDHKLNGSLDEISLYNRALSAAEVAAIYAAGSAGKCKGPNITVQPQSQAVLAGSNATFAVSATGFGVLHYQWQLNGLPVAGATTSMLTLNGVQIYQASSYNVVVSNTLGVATSAVATLTVWLPPAITSQPAIQTVMAGTDVSFSATAAGTSPLYYQWQRDGVSLTDGGRVSGASNATLTISGVQGSDAGNYSLVVTNAYGTATSANALLTVLYPPCAPVPPGLVSWWPGENSTADMAGGE
jgi:Concanavalin A-like lectin/glucanases superfamily/Immunoglobulin I-set domain/Immunoglobulin domain